MSPAFRPAPAMDSHASPLTRPQRIVRFPRRTLPTSQRIDSASGRSPGLERLPGRHFADPLAISAYLSGETVELKLLPRSGVPPCSNVLDLTQTQIWRSTGE